MDGVVSIPLLLEPEPQSVGRARSWVVQELRGLGRDDLADAAELGVSELVTNAILHASPPITVRLAGTLTHPRVEVADRSLRPPAVNAEMAEEDMLLSTVGRGLGLVALYSATWGAEVSSAGKVVWFEPMHDTHDGDELAQGGLAGDVFDLDQVVAARLADVSEPPPTLTVRLLGMPVRLFAAYRGWYDELRRELRLLSLVHGSVYPVAQEISEVAVQVEAERRQVRGIERLEEAIRSGEDRVDLEYVVPASAPDTMERLRGLLASADEFCREQKLLSVEAPPQQAALREWYLGEFARQRDGQDPTPWSGDYGVESAE